MSATKTHGGPRPCAGRKSKRSDPLESVSLTLEPEHRKWAEKLGAGNLSAGARILMDMGIQHILSVMPSPELPLESVKRQSDGGST